MDAGVRSGVMVAGALMLCNSLSCQTAPNAVIHESESLTVVLRELPARYPLLAPYHHPYPIQTNILFGILESFDYQAGSVLPFSSARPHHVFSKHQAEILAPELSKALNELRPQQVAAFSVADEEKPDRRTTGFWFVVGEELHLILEDLRKPRYEGEQKPYQQEVSRWELLLNDGQRHYTTRSGGKGILTNWVITPLR